MFLARTAQACIVCVFFCFVVDPAAAQLSYRFEWGHPSPQGNTVHGFAFADSLSGWAVN